MTFKKRILEEGIGDAWDKTKEFAKNNTGLAAGLGGLGAGALYNYATGGAEDMAKDRVDDLLDFQKGAPSQLASAEMGTKDDFTDLRDAQVHLAGRGGSGLTPFTWLSGRTEDLNPFTGNQGFEQDVKDYQTKNPDAQISYGTKNVGNIIKQPDDFKLNDQSVSLSNSSDDAWKNYQNGIKNQYANISDADVQKGINANPELKQTQDNMANDIADSTSDSYRNKMLGGAALGAGGAYAARKLKERNQ